MARARVRTAEEVDLPPSMSNQPVEGGTVKALVDRIEALEEERSAVNEQLKEVYAEAKAEGLMVKVLRLVVRRRKRGRQEVRAEDDMVQLYEDMLG